MVKKGSIAAAVVDGRVLSRSTSLRTQARDIAYGVIPGPLPPGPEHVSSVIKSCLSMSVIVLDVLNSAAFGVEVLPRADEGIWSHPAIGLLRNASLPVDAWMPAIDGVPIMLHGERDVRACEHARDGQTMLHSPRFPIHRVLLTRSEM